MTRDVLLVHGIWNSRVWLVPLAARLRRAGFSPRLWGYASVGGGAERAVPQLIATLRASDAVHLVAHSLGGLIALEALRRAPDLPVPRVVCLGTPLHGSDTARWLLARGRIGSVLGRSAPILRDGLQAWDGRAQVGAIAGNVPHGVGALLGALQDDSDGTVRIVETRIPGLADHCIVPVSHTGLAISALAAQQAAHFLRHGHFAPGNASAHV